MKRSVKIFCALILAAASALPVFAQSEDDENNSSITFSNYQLNRAGDQFIKISLATTVPLNFPDLGKIFSSERKLSIGGMGSLGYHYFLTDQLSVGFDAAFGFNVTIGSHVLNYVPLVATVTWQPSVGKFEFPLTMGVGFSWHTYIGYTYFPGLVLKPEAGVHYRISPSWSIGADFSWMFMPEFNALYGNGENYYGQFATAGISARYYF